MNTDNNNNNTNTNENNENNKNNENNENNKNIKNEKENPQVEKKRPENSILRKLKYGSVAMIFTVAFVAVIFIINVVTTAVNNVKPLMLDMTKEQIFGISDASRELLKDITEPIEIVFFQPIDMYEKTVTGGKMIVNCVKTFANEFPNITIREIDIIKEPGKANEFKTSNLSQNPSTKSVAIKSKGKPKLYADNAFFVTAQSTKRYWAFNGEKTIVSGILTAVSVDEPLVYFTTGHSESYPQEILTLFADNGYKLDMIDLSMADQETVNEAKIIVICNPQKDFIGASDIMEKSEIDKVASYLYQFGSVMYFSSPEVGALTNLDQLLSEYGIAFEQASIVRDNEKALDIDGLYLNANYFVANNVGDELTASIRNQPSPSKTIVPRAKPIKILNIASERAVSPVLTSSASSYVVYGDGTYSSPGASNLLVVAQKTQYVDNNPKTSLFLVSGSYLYLGLIPNDAYSNADILLNAMRIMTSKKVATDIKFKLFDSTALSMDMDEQGKWTLICILLLPTVVSVLGIVVWLRRRHS